MIACPPNLLFIVTLPCQCRRFHRNVPKIAASKSNINVYNPHYIKIYIGRRMDGQKSSTYKITYIYSF